jgi:hypothetical protein
MVLPQAWLRKMWLRRALRDYPLYDPPHKVEERLLSKEKATENFHYFMRVRQQRLAYLQSWLRRYFGATFTLDEKGIGVLNRWGKKYAGFLLVTGADGHPTDSYFNYDPPWTGENGGHNVLFDMGIALGETMISNCHKLHWDVDPISAILPRTARMLKGAAGMSFQRPMLTRFDDPLYHGMPLHQVYGFAAQMMLYMTTFRGVNRFNAIPRNDRYLISEGLVNDFAVALKYRPGDDPYKLRQHVAPENYLKFMDKLLAEEDKSDE